LEVLLVQGRIDQDKDVKLHAPQANVFRGKADLSSVAYMRRDAERKPSFGPDNPSPRADRTEKRLPQTPSVTSRAGFEHRDGDRKKTTPRGFLWREYHFKIQILANRCFSALEKARQKP